MIRKAHKIYFTFLLALTALLSLSVSAKADFPLPLITSAQADTATNRLTINGADFGTKKPVVVLAGRQLTVSSFTDKQIIAVLPSGLNGNYLLTVTNSNSHLFGIFVASVGAVGQQGPQGNSIKTFMDDGSVYPKGCGAVGGLVLITVDAQGHQVAGTSPQYVCNGLQGAQGPPGSSGTVQAGAGLILNNGTISVDPEVIQNRVTGSCGGGQAIQTIGQDGTVTCGSPPSPVSDGVAQLNAVISPAVSERTILDNGPLNLKVSCELAGLAGDVKAHFSINPNGSSVNVLFDNGSPEFFSASTLTDRVITSGASDGGRKFLVQLVRQADGKVFTVQGWAFNIASASPPRCQIVWTIISTSL